MKNSQKIATFFLIALLSTLFISKAVAQTDKINVLFIGDSESCDSGLGNSLVTSYSSFFAGQPIELKVTAYSDASPVDFINANRVAKWGNYMRYGDGTKPAVSEGLITDTQAYPSIDRLMKFRAYSKVADVVYVQLGTNLIWQSSTVIKHQVSQLLQKIFTINPVARVVWITPPNDRLYTESKEDATDGAIVTTLKAVQADMVAAGYPSTFTKSIVTRMLSGMRPGDAGGWPNRDQEHFKKAPSAWLVPVAQSIVSTIDQ